MGNDNDLEFSSIFFKPDLLGENIIYNDDDNDSSESEIVLKDENDGIGNVEIYANESRGATTGYVIIRGNCSNDETPKTIANHCEPSKINTTRSSM